MKLTPQQRAALKRHRKAQKRLHDRNRSADGQQKSKRRLTRRQELALRPLSYPYHPWVTWLEWRHLARVKGLTLQHPKFDDYMRRTIMIVDEVGAFSNA